MEQMATAEKHITTQQVLNSLQTIESSSLAKFCADTGGAAIVSNGRVVVANIHAGLLPNVVKNPTQSATIRFQEALVHLASKEIEEETISNSNKQYS